MRVACLKNPQKQKPRSVTSVSCDTVRLHLIFFSIPILVGSTINMNGQHLRSHFFQTAKQQSASHSTAPQNSRICSPPVVEIFMETVNFMFHRCIFRFVLELRYVLALNHIHCCCRRRSHRLLATSQSCTTAGHQKRADTYRQKQTVPYLERIHRENPRSEKALCLRLVRASTNIFQPHDCMLGPSTP